MNKTRGVLLTYFVWLALAAFVAYVAWNLHATAVYVVSILTSMPNLRPFGWTSESVQPFSRFSIFVIGSVGLIYCLWLENRLQRAHKENELWQVVGRWLLIWVIVLAVCLLILRI